MGREIARHGLAWRPSAIFLVWGSPEEVPWCWAGAPLLVLAASHPRGGSLCRAVEQG